jgi:UDP-3-O-[3-hydroxymyristoyl] glucosamine N-acyltransferase
MLLALSVNYGQTPRECRQSWKVDSAKILWIQRKMIEINKELIKQVLGIDTDEEIRCESLGLITDHNKKNMLSFLDEQKFVADLNSSPNISAIFVSKKLSSKIAAAHIKKIICDDPRYYFYMLLNYLNRQSYKEKDTKIHPTAVVDSKASVATHNVKIGENVVIEPNVIIFPDVIVGNNSIVRAGAILGSQGFEHKRTTKGILTVFHDGQVIIGENVTIGANNIIDKGFLGRSTKVDHFTKCNSFVFIGHCAQIGKRCLIGVGAIITGSSTVEDDVWIGPSATISNQVRVGRGARVTIGSVVTQSVEPGAHVTGNFAIDHSHFIKFIKSIR